MFHTIEGLTALEKAAANVREFIGNGTPYLKVPGLSSVESVRIGRLSIPLEEERVYPVDSTGKKFETAKVPMISLQMGPDGTPILLRSILSNDGVWQKDELIFVQGAWTDDPAGNSPVVTNPPIEPPVTNPPADGDKKGKAAA